MASLPGEVPKAVSCKVCDMLGHHNDQYPEIKEVRLSRTKTYQHFFFLIIITRLSQPRKEFKNDELLEVFKKVEVNLPFLMDIKSIPRYAKNLKELCTHKRSRSQEKVMVSKNVSSLIKKNLSEKCVDPSIFLLAYTIGNRDISSTMLDLGVVEDVLVKIENLIFLADFYIIEMNHEFSRTSPTILLGKSFLKIAKAKINVDKGLLSVEFDGDIESFNSFDDVNSSNDHVSLCALDTLESLKTQEEHDKFNELIDQTTLEYVENEFAKNKLSDDDFSIFLDFFASVNDEHALVDNLATNGHHALDNDFASSNEHHLGRNINNDNEHTLKVIDIENDLGTNLIEIAPKLDDEKFF
ncbi:uncharacterized protein E5676_scaffold594G00410 [Cucumis melo var. makuwa]|uniref:Uncharacterized protein n=1 Tax=Cucumis melo var. makuwa TaxID=1194695 RepID=A0A5A7TE46_CUCMM|nr:uncharacterized protein E6C27_scaffold67G00370 [Cucumis melo var. makuwa]TYK06328.1 uncharacterized protein E5676_scaffold594G00410 [Cucumis melo var. makuwa]